MIVCKTCDTQNPNDNAFCQQCGNPLEGGDTVGGLITPEPFRPEPNRPKNAELAPGDIFAGRYTVIEKIGQGGMGTVYKTSETLAGTERMIALKLIRADRLADQRAIDKLVKEGALTQDIRHPNIVNVYNVGVHEGQPFVAMELVNGVSLRNWHRLQTGAGKDVPFNTAAAIVRELIDGLEAAHNLNVIHRDLKPENIMLTAEPNGADVKLQILDFGIARAPGTVETGTGLGTPHYMAPEQITNADSAGPPADFYSVFKIWYELLMDVLPQGHWQPPSSGRPDVGPEVDKLIERGLALKPSQRPQNTREFRDWMREALPGFPDFAVEPEGKRRDVPEPVPPLEPSPDPVPEKKGNKTKIGLGMLGAVVLFFYAIDDSGTGSDLPPEPPPEQPDYSYLSGQWNSTQGDGFAVSVSGNGDFQGQGQNFEGYSLQIAGNVLSGSYGVGDGTMTYAGKMEWDRGCHINFTTYNPDNSVNMASTFHIDHAPGAACPARFNN